IGIKKAFIFKTSKPKDMKAKANTKRRCLFGAKIKNYKHMGSITLKWDKIKGYTANGLKTTP
ncbi:MAG TPA: hypothetical protein PKE52_08395, partial [Bacteroidales bacterium]|nr:hypothetical protein [Bacteroidales bacterium]